MSIVKPLKQTGVVVAFVLLAWLPVLNAATNNPSTEKTVNSLLTAIATNNYNALVASAAPALKSRITEETFQRVSAQLGPRLKKGYKLQYMGDLKQQGVDVLLWKIAFQDGGDDLLARLVIQEDRVAGFWFQ
jgi:hypothetical protein